MLIKRYCGRERLPGGERRWRRLARAVGYAGRVEVQGFGVSGRPGAVHRSLARGDVGLLTYGDFSPGVIRIWVRCYCAAADIEDMDEAEAEWSAPPEYKPLEVFAHELGHYAQWRRDKDRYGDEKAADVFGTLLLAHVG